ncbi:CO/COL/TOC1, conserved site [Dillenia turbinata]|uniref:Protein TIFY n=1 Tax=Dillenia turbinata TaxID=194707 RepID=A0AAN8VI97_9MAGN
MDCNLELGLLPSSSSSSSSSARLLQKQKPPMIEVSSGKNQQEQQLTIFYNGKICVCDVTELQARAIISLASQEMEERARTPRRGPSSEPLSPTFQSPMCQSPALSMKRSLQRFLQKRRHRVQAASPYHY